MKTAPLVLLLVAVSAATTVATSLLLRPGQTAAAEPDGAALARIQDSLDELRRENESLQKEIAELRTAPAARADSITREPDLDELVERAVARWMQDRDAAVAAAAVTAKVTAPAGPPFSLEASLGQLLNPYLGDEDRDALWQQALASGKMKELIGALEKSAALEPKNAALQFELGYAYLQPIISGEAAGPQAGEWSMKADAAFDKTLALDPLHWNARFNKAVSYSFWPPLFGKQQAAITNFETLITQQGGSNASPGFAETYLYLGNLYLQTGQLDKAKAIWNEGLGLFPGHRGLTERYQSN